MSAQIALSRTTLSSGLPQPAEPITKPPATALQALARAHLLLHLHAHPAAALELSPIPLCAVQIYGRKAWQQTLPRERSDLIDRLDRSDTDEPEPENVNAESGYIGIEGRAGVVGMYAENEDADDRSRTTTLAFSPNLWDSDVVEGVSNRIGYAEDAAAVEAEGLVEKAVAEIRKWDAEAGGKAAIALGLEGGDEGASERGRCAARLKWHCVVS